MGWSEAAICALLTAYRDKSLELNKGNCRPKDWQEIVSIVNSTGDGKGVKSVKQSRDKLDNLKRRFKVEKEKQDSMGGIPSRWLWYSPMLALMSSSPKFFSNAEADIDVKKPIEAPTPKLHENHHNPVTLAHPDESVHVKPNDEDIPIGIVEKGKAAVLSPTLSGAGSPPPSSEQDNTPERDDDHDDHPGIDVTSPQVKNHHVPGVSGKTIKKPRRQKSSQVSEGPIRELAASIKEFGDVYAKIELTKLECLTAIEKARAEQLAAIEKSRREFHLELAKMVAGIFASLAARPSTAPETS